MLAVEGLIATAPPEQNGTELYRGAVRGFLVKRDCIFLFSVIRYNEKLKPVDCESYACRDT